jgi:hypothetical protein
VDHQIQNENVNWSGFANYKNVPVYSTKGAHSSFYEMTSTFNVPPALDAYGETGCSALGAVGAIEMEVGIDAPTLKGGVVANNPGWINDGGCFVYTPNYNAEIGAGTSSSIIDLFAVNPGDIVIVTVWDTSPTTGYVNIGDYTTQVGGTYAITTNPIAADSAEFLMARVYVNGALDYIPNYVQTFWVDAWAMDFNKHTYGPGTNIPTNAGYLYTYNYVMTDFAGDQNVSFANPYNYTFNTGTAFAAYGLNFFVEGCAQYTGCP